VRWKDYHLAMNSKEIGKNEVQDPAVGLAQEDATWILPVAMTGRASPAKAAVGDEWAFEYIASLPQPQRGIAEAVDALAAKTLPKLQRSVKWAWRITASATVGASAAAGSLATSS
jgi:hypothetical protein